MDGRQNDKLNLMKCVAIYSVVFLHIMLPGLLGQAVNCLARFAVPLFFLTAGYFSWEKDKTLLAQSCRRAGVRLLLACLPALLLGCALARQRDEAIAAYLLGRLRPVFLKEFLLWQVVPLPYAWPLWFIGALFLVQILWWAMTWLAQKADRHLPYNGLALLALILLAAHLSLAEGRALAGLGSVNSLWVRNAWLDAFPFFALGAWMREHRELVRSLRSRTLWIGVALSGLLSLAERRLVGPMDLHLGAILAAPLLMAAAIGSPEVHSSFLRKTACFCGQNLTFSIFALHIPLYGVIKEWQGAVPAFAFAWARPWLLPFLISAVSTLLALSLYGLSLGVRRRFRRDRA